jgi:hypothetical protein
MNLPQSPNHQLNCKPTQPNPLHQTQCLVPSGALMVVNHKGRIVYATSPLGNMLGFPPKQLAAMDLQAIIPPPYAYLCGNFLKAVS